MSDAGKGIVVGLNNFKNNIHWCIGNGKQGKLGVDPRCLSSVLGKPKLRPQFGHLFTVQFLCFLELMVQVGILILLILYEQDDARKIASLPSPHPGIEDRCIWKLDKFGRVSLKSFLAHKYDSTANIVDGPVWKVWWKGSIPMRLLFFGWRMS